MTECDCLGCEHPIALINSPNFISLLFNAITFNIIYKTFLSNNNCVSMREKNVIVHQIFFMKNKIRKPFHRFQTATL